MRTILKNNTETPPTVVIQALDGISTVLITELKNQLSKHFPKVEVSQSIPLLKLSIYKPRNRYRVDLLFLFFNRRTSSETITMGVTSKVLVLPKMVMLIVVS